jgi:peptidoglycan/xylan/chitin deacetylase (PgdA/CDA1 family)
MNLIKRWEKPHWRILCYHSISIEHGNNFINHLQTFIKMGFKFVGLEEGLIFLNKAQTFNNPIMTVTFDDGDRTICDIAQPILEELGIKAFLYVTADYINKGITYRDDHPLPAMNWEQLLQWIAAGHGVGSHTLTHAPLRLCNHDRLKQECIDSKKILEDNLDVSINHLSYPWGQHSQRTYNFLRDNKLYDSVATIDRGRMFSGYDPCKLRRDVCYPGIPIESLIKTMKLADRYYWLRHLRKKPVGYFDRHLEEKWEAIEI